MPEKKGFLAIIIIIIMQLLLCGEVCLCAFQFQFARANFLVKNSLIKDISLRLLQNSIEKFIT